MEKVLKKRLLNIFKILADSIKVQEISGLAERLGLKGVSASRFINGVIQLDRYAPEGTEFHEAFHVVFRTFLTDNEISRLYRDARNRYGIPTKEELERFKNQEPISRSIMSTEELTNLWYEENMAEEFREYMLSNQEVKEEKNKSWLGRIFERLWNLIKAIVSGNKKNKIESLFKEIEKGSFKDATTQYNVFSNNKTAPYALLKSRKTELNRPLLRSESNRIIAGIAQRLYNKIEENPNIEKGTLEYNKLIIESFREEKDFYTFNTEDRTRGNWSVEIDEWISKQEEYFPEDGTEEEQDEYAKIVDAELANIVDPISKMFYAIPTLGLSEEGNIIVINSNPEHTYLSDNFNEIMRSVENLMDFHNNFNLAVEDLNELENMEQDVGEHWQRDAYENGGYERIGDKLRAIIQFASAPIDEFGFGWHVLNTVDSTKQKYHRLDLQIKSAL